MGQHTVIETRFPREVEKGGNGRAEDIGVQDAGTDASPGEGQGEVHCNDGVRLIPIRDPSSGWMHTRNGRLSHTTFG